MLDLSIKINFSSNMRYLLGLKTKTLKTLGITAVITTVNRMKSLVIILDRFASFRVFILVRTFFVYLFCHVWFFIWSSYRPVHEIYPLKRRLNFTTFAFKTLLFSEFLPEILQAIPWIESTPHFRAWILSKSGCAFSQRSFQGWKRSFFLDTVWILVFWVEKNNCLLIEWFSKILTRIVSFSQFWLLSNQNSAQRF